MAINPSSLYPANIDTSDPTGYPRGKARDVAVAGDNTGTPLTAAIMNDLFGFQQALLSEASAVPSGTPDKVGASQYLDALKTVVSSLASGASSGTERITADGTFTPPIGVKFLKITCIGGGGGGGGTYPVTFNGLAHCGGGGGGSGGIGYEIYTIPNPLAPPVFTIDVGAGGSAGASNENRALTTRGGTGGNTTVSVAGLGVICTGVGGQGGNGHADLGGTLVGFGGHGEGGQGGWTLGNTGMRSANGGSGTITNAGTGTGQISFALGGVGGGNSRTDIDPPSPTGDGYGRGGVGASSFVSNDGTSTSTGQPPAGVGFAGSVIFEW